MFKKTIIQIHCTKGVCLVEGQSKSFNYADFFAFLELQKPLVIKSLSELSRRENVYSVVCQTTYDTTPVFHRLGLDPYNWELPLDVFLRLVCFKSPLERFDNSPDLIFRSLLRSLNHDFEKD